jgi:hypothetical protein
MIRSSILRLAAMAAFVLLVPALAGGAAFAQTAAYGSIGLYADEARSSNAVSFAGAYTEFTMYVFFNPSSRGLAAAEFSIGYPANVIPADVTTSSLISVSLGEIDGGVSVAFNECQNDWVWTHHQRCYLMSSDATRIEIEVNAVAGDYQASTCELGYPIEPVFISSLLCLNAACPPDTAAPLFVGASSATVSSVIVTFSEPVLRQCAENPSSYEIFEFDSPSNILPVGEAVLLSGGTSVNLYTPEPCVPGRKYVVRATGVCDLWGNAVPSWSTAEFVRADHEPPRVSSASAATDSLLTVEFNEPVSHATATNPNNYHIYRNGILAGCVPYRATQVAQNRVVLSFAGLNLLPTVVVLTVKVANVRDLAGNLISSSYNSASFVVPDMSPPYVAAVQALGRSLVSVRFNEEVSAASAQIAGSYEIYRRDSFLITVPVSSAAVQTDRRYVLLSLGSDLTIEVPYLLRVFDIEDLHGNRMADTSLTEFVWPDTSPPVPLSAVALARDLIRIMFDERLQETTAEIAANYHAYETANPSITIPVLGAELEAGESSVLLGLGAFLEYDASYTIRVSGVKDLKGNAISSATVTTSYPDTFPPVFIGVTATAANELELVFDEKLSPIAAGEPSNYTLYETDNPSNVVEIASAVPAGDGSRVRLGLATSMTAVRSYTISVSNVADLKGNVLAPGSSLIFIYGDVVPPTLLSARTDTSTTVLARFSEKLDNVTAENTDNYIVYETANQSATIPIVGAALGGDSSSVLLSLGSPLAAEVAYSLQVAGVTDRTGNPVPAGSVVPIRRPDTAPPHLIMAEAVTLMRVRVRFDEPVTAATAGTAANYLITPIDNPGATIVPLAVDLPDNTTAELHLGVSLSSGTTYRVQVSDVTDLEGNAIAPGSEEIFSTPSIPVEPGRIGLFVGGYWNFEVYYTGSLTPFTMYVWCLAGSADMIAAEFGVPLPANVIYAGITMNPAITVSLGEIATDLSVAFGACQSGWVWAVAADCFLLNSNQSVISLNPEPLFANCLAGYPLETPQIIASLYCNSAPPVATLLQESAARFDDGAVQITWRLSRMDDGTRFGVSRREEGKSEYGASSSDVEADGLSFTYRDESAEPGKTYRYRVEYADGSGSRVLFETDPVVVPALPLALEQNWPNPFNPSTTILYYLPESGHVRLEIFDVAGRRVACLVDRNEERGNRTVVWDGSSESGKPAATGIYIYRLTAGRETLSRKMVLIR